MRVLATCLALLALPALAGDVVATRTLRPGAIVTEGDLRATGEAGAAGARRIAEMTGLEVRVAVYAGRPVPRGALGPPTLVERNEIVVMEYRRGALMLRTEGRALDAAAKGGRVRVMNLDSRITVSGVVIAPARVRVAP